MQKCMCVCGRPPRKSDAPCGRLSARADCLPSNSRSPSCKLSSIFPVRCSSVPSARKRKRQHRAWRVGADRQAARHCAARSARRPGRSSWMRGERTAQNENSRESEIGPGCTPSTGATRPWSRLRQTLERAVNSRSCGRGQGCLWQGVSDDARGKRRGCRPGTCTGTAGARAGANAITAMPML